MQHFILIAEALYWIPLAYILIRFGVHKHTTISDHVATGTPRKIYTPTTLLSMTFLTIFCFWWLFPEYGISWIGYALVGAAYIAIVATTLIPRVAYILPHDISAGLAGTAISFLLLLFVFNENVSEGVRAIILVAYLIMAITGPIY